MLINGSFLINYNFLRVFLKAFILRNKQRIVHRITRMQEKKTEHYRDDITTKSKKRKERWPQLKHSE